MDNEDQWWSPGAFDSRPSTGGEQLELIKDLLIRGGSNLFNALEQSDETIFPGRRDRIKGWSEGAENFTTKLTGNETAGKVVGAITEFGGEVVHPDTIDTGAFAISQIDSPLPGPADAVGLGVFGGNLIRKGKRAVPDLVRAIEDAFNPALKSRKGAYVLQGVDGSQTVVRDSNGLVNNVFYSTTQGGGGNVFRHSIKGKTNRGIYKRLFTQDPKLIDQAEIIIKNLDEFRTSKGASQNFTNWNANRPTTGFKGNRTVKYTNAAGEPSEIGFRWSVSKNTYVPYDVLAREATILKRFNWNVNRSSKAAQYANKLYGSAREANKQLIQVLRKLRDDNPQRYWDIMGDTRRYADKKGIIYVEHIHAQNSPIWQYGKLKYKPRDTANLMIVKNDTFGRLKTAIEKHIYDNKNYPFYRQHILDYDRKRDVLVLKRLNRENGRLTWVGDIEAITNPRDWKGALERAINGHRIGKGALGEIRQIEIAQPDLPAEVDVQHNITGYQDPRWPKK
tara:strand:+ start:61 stop:1578 length:1518 start_codon:yes stop_codon:yes gene_type:complete